MTLTDTSVDELEAIFDLEIPCGGNSTPKNRPCPHQAAAVWVCTHRCDFDAKSFKCDACYAEWYNTFGDDCVCSKCAEVMPKFRMYRRL